MMGDCQDRSLADAGRQRIEWAAAGMPVLGSIRENWTATRPLAGLTIGACLHVTTETANLMRVLQAGGASVSLCASNPLSTQDDVAAALNEVYSIPTYAIRGEGTATYYDHINKVLDTRPQVTMDDGADLVNTIVSRRRELIPGVRGSLEETTTGVIRLRAMAAAGKLPFPVIAVNDARTKHMFDNRYGTGQSTIDGILRATNILLAGCTFVVVGFGWCGRGLALRAKGLGANVVVVEVDPLRALEAAMEGYRVMSMSGAAEIGDVFVTVTGNKHVIDARHFQLMKDGAIVANSGHFDVEINVKALEAAATARREVRPEVEEYVLADGRRIRLLAQGRLVNLAAAEGHPAQVMDMSFANQALAARFVFQHEGGLERKVYPVPAAIDEEVARLKLAAMGLQIEQLTVEQEAYLASYEAGT